VQSREQMNLGAGLGVAVREFATASGRVDYALFVGRDLCGVVEAKPEGMTPLWFLGRPARGQVRFEYVTSGTEILFLIMPTRRRAEGYGIFLWSCGDAHGVAAVANDLPQLTQDTIPLSTPKTMSSNWTRPESLVRRWMRRGSRGRLRRIASSASRGWNSMPSSRRVAALGIRVRYLIAHHLGCRSQTSGCGDGLLPSSFLPLEVEHRAQNRDYDQSDRGAAEKREAPVGCNCAAINDVAGLQLGRHRPLVGAEFSHCSADFKSAPRSTSLVSRALVSPLPVHEPETGMGMYPIEVSIDCREQSAHG
jgi:hypothetical protein